MSNTIRIKRRDSGGAAGAPTSLENAELAYNEADNTLYYGFGTGGAGGSATSIIGIAGPGSYSTLTTNQTISGDKTFSGTVDFTGTVDFNSIKLTNVADPTNPQDAATKAYVDAAIQGFDLKEPVRAVAVANVDITDVSATSTNGSEIDGVALSDGDRVLLTGQSDASENGIYVYSGSNDSLSRATDADDDSEVTKGMYVLVLEGDNYTGSGFVLSTDDPIVVDTTNLAFTQIAGGGGGGGDVNAGDGLTKSGSTLNVVTASASRIVVNSDDIDLATTGVTASTYRSVTVDVYGRVTAGSNPTTLAGYGITDAASSATTLTAGTGLTGGGDLSDDRSFALTGQALALHNLATNGVIVRTGSGTVAGRTITGTSDRIDVSNGDGVSGNPTLDISSTYAGQATLGTVATGTWNADVITLGYGGTGRDLSGDSDGAMYKKSGTELVVATEGTDYLSADSEINGGSF